VFLFSSNVYSVTEYTITFSVTGSTNGSISATYNGASITSGTSEYPGGTVVFTASPNLGFHVKQWTMNSSVIQGNTSNTYSLTLSQNITVTVEFEASATITFVVDDSDEKTYTGFYLRGTWDTDMNYESSWDDYAIQGSFYDDGTNGDITGGDNIWTIIVYLVPDGGINNWLWAFSDLDGNLVGEGSPFTIVDNSPQTFTYQVSALKDEFTANIKVSPNPTKDFLNISADKNYQVQILDLNGKIVKTIEMTNNQVSVDLSDQNTGMYFVKLRDGINIKYLKIIKD